MELTFSSLVKLLLFLALTVLMITLALFIKGVTDDTTDTACVRTRAFALQTDPTTNIPLRGCDARVREYKAGTSDKKIASQFVDDVAWCQLSFGVTENLELIKGDRTFCHVCAIYTRADQKPVTRIYEKLANYGLLNIDSFDDPNVDTATLLTGLKARYDPTLAKTLRTVSLNMSQPVGIIYVQAHNDNKNFFERMFSNPLRNAAAGAVAGAATVTGAGVVSGITGITAIASVATIGAPVIVAGAVVMGIAYAWHVDDITSETISGIVIRPYTSETLDDMGCTTARVTSDS